MARKKSPPFSCFNDKLREREREREAKDKERKSLRRMIKHKITSKLI
jgi:hypothetical protein